MNMDGRVGFAGVVRRFSPLLSFVVSFIDFWYFDTITIIIVVVIVIDVFLGLSYRNVICFDIQH